MGLGGLVVAYIIMTLFFATLPAYLLGSIPCGLLLGKLFGYGDIRKIGSGNIGATNALRTGNKKLAAFTLFFDGLKGYAAVYMLSSFSIEPTISPNLAIAGFFAVIGHIFPVWLKFKGGKGVATAIGTLFAIAPVLAGCVIVVWLITFYFSPISSLSALTGFAVTTILALGLAWSGSVAFISACYMLVVTLLIFTTHRSNIAKLLKGEEHKWVKKDGTS